MSGQFDFTEKNIDFLAVDLDRELEEEVVNNDDNFFWSFHKPLSTYEDFIYIHCSYLSKNSARNSGEKWPIFDKEVCKNF